MSRRIHTFTLLKNWRSGANSPASNLWCRRVSTLLVGALVAIGAAAAVSASASGSSSSFETGTEPFTTLECANPNTQFTRVTSPVREGSYAAKFTESASDVWLNGSVRCLAGNYDSGETTGNDYYYHLSFFIPSSGITDNLIWELHHPYSLYSIPGCGVAPHALLIDRGGFVYRVFTGNCNGTVYQDQEVLQLPGLNPYPRNQWVDFVVHIKFQEASTGSLEIYYRTGSNPWPSSPQVVRTNVPTMPYYNAGNVHNVKLYMLAGLYPGYSGYNANDTIYVDDVRRETSLAAALGGAPQTSPPPAPQSPPPAPAGSAPANSSLPVVSGQLKVGQTLTTTNGTWTGSPTGYAYQWQYSRDNGATWLNVRSEERRVGKESDTCQNTLIHARVSTTNSTGSTVTNSAPVGPISAAPVSSPSPAPAPAGSAPANSSLPVVSGQLKVGQTLTTTNGTWTGSPTGYAYQWQYSRDNGSTWLNVNGATTTVFQESDTFQNTLIRARVTATNSTGSTVTNSAPVGPIAAAPVSSPSPAPAPAGSAPANSSLPVVSGQLKVGQTLTTTNGSWTGSPTGYAYQWQYSRDNGATWLNVNGATTTVFQESVTLHTTLVRVQMTATNAVGSTSAASSAVGPIAAASPPAPAPAAPASTSLPLVSGQLKVGQTLTT